jgi:hypothetical protein
MTERLTYPHDYRTICEGDPAPLVVGGQAINLWAINYLVSQVAKAGLGSKDLDIIAGEQVIAYLKNLPGWVYRPNKARNWLDSRIGFLYGSSSDGRKLSVEILHSVNGLDESDLAAAAFIKSEGVTYRVLDPIAMLKAKAANLRDIDQAGPPPRNDREHLHMISHCVPLFLREIHSAAVEDVSKEKEVLAVISRAFKTLQNRDIASTLIKEGIEPGALIPQEFAESELPRIRKAYQWQMPLVVLQPARPSAPAPISPPTKPAQGPRMGI